jgi:hypothetical protein
MCNDRVAVLSGIVGIHYKTVHFAPCLGASYMFCSDLSLREYIESRGWIFCYLDCSDINQTDVKQPNLRCKEVKFLAILQREEFKFLNNYNYIIWADCSLKLHPKHVEELISATQTAPISLKKMTEGDIYEELEASMLQDRYKKDRDVYLKLIQKYKECGYNTFSNRPIHGLICYNMKFKEQVLTYGKETLNVLYNNNIIQDQIVAFFTLQKINVNWLTWQVPIYSVYDFIMNVPYPALHYNFDHPPIVIGFL